MREPERDLGRLQDIVEAADHIADFTDGFSQEELSNDKLRYFAVVKNVEIIGEAAYMLSLRLKEDYCAIPWNDIIRMRHVLVHGYATILPELLWHTALVDVPVLKIQIEGIISELVADHPAGNSFSRSARAVPVTVDLCARIFGRFCRHRSL